MWPFNPATTVVEPQEEYEDIDIQVRSQSTPIRLAKVEEWERVGKFLVFTFKDQSEMWIAVSDVLQIAVKPSR